MRKHFTNTTLAVCLAIGMAPALRAGIVTEIEADGSFINNALGTAQIVPVSAFTTPAPATVFNPPGYATATIQGSNGSSDVDFFGFSSNGGRVYLDMDNSLPAFDPIVALFDGTGTLLAYSDDSDPDDGSVNTVDSFVGVFTLPTPGMYYIGISEAANFPTAALTGTETPLMRPDGAFGGYAVSGVASGVSSYDFSGAQPGGGSYALHVSVSPVPEPASMLLAGTALLVLGCMEVRRQKKANQQ